MSGRMAERRRLIRAIGSGSRRPAGPFLLERREQMIEQTVEPFLCSAGLRRAQVFDFLERQQRMAGFDNPVAQGQMTLRLPGQARFDFLHDRRDRRGQVALEKVANENRVHDDFAGRGEAARCLAAARARNEAPSMRLNNRSLLRVTKPSGKMARGNRRLGEDAGGAFERFAVQSFAINAEPADARQQKRLHPVLHEQMPAGHDVERPRDLAREQSQNHRVARPAVIGGQQHAGSRHSAKQQALRAHAFPGSDAEAPAQDRSANTTG